MRLISIVDVCIQTPMHKLEEMHMLAEALAKRELLPIVNDLQR